MTKIQDSQILKRILLYLKPFKPRVIILAVCLVIMTCSSFVQPLILRNITDQGMVNKNFDLILFFSIMLLFAYTIHQVSGLVQSKTFIKIHNEFSLALYKEAFEKLLRLPINYYHDRSNTEIVSTITTDADRVASIADQGLLFSITNIMQIVSGLIGLIIIDWKLTLVVVSAIPVKFYIVKKLSIKKRTIIQELINTIRKFNAWFGDNVGGIREIKLWNIFMLKVNQFTQIQKDVLKANTSNSMLDKYNMFIETLLDVSINCILYILSGFLIVKGSFTIGGAFAFLSYSSYVIGPIGILLNINYSIAQIIPSANRLFDFLDLPEEKLDVVEGKFETKVDAEKKDALIDVEMLEFYYDKSRPLLKNVSFKVYEGEKIGIIGLNGTGKSTIINLLLGFYQPVSGKIRIDGKELNELGLGNLRSKFAVVSQDPYFFQATIAQNIDISESSSKMTIENACQKSGAAKFINKLECGYEQYIGQRGAKLSGGEKQKLALASAFIKQANIVILDEATSNYDVDSDQYIRNVIAHDLIGKTVLLVTHDYSALKQLDRVLELKNGTIVEVDVTHLDGLQEGLG